MYGNLPPVDSAFIRSTKVIAEQAGEALRAPSSWTDSTLLVCVAALCMFLILCSIKLLVDLLPSLLGCIFRGKENINLENSAKLRRERNRLALCCIPTFCLSASIFRLFNPSIFADIPDGLYFLCITGMFFAYEFTRLLIKHLIVRKPERLGKTAINCSYTFFILTTGFILICSGIGKVAGIDFENLRQAILIGIALIYMIFLIRKTQIFASFCNVFSTFLYLCALEFLPTGVLVALAVLL